jgi:hypothetical protein
MVLLLLRSKGLYHFPFEFKPAAMRLPARFGYQIKSGSVTLHHAGMRDFIFYPYSDWKMQDWFQFALRQRST